MTEEGYVKDVVKKLLEAYNIHPAKSAGKDIGQQDGWYFMPVPMGQGVKGIPDFVGCYLGRFFSVETKAPGGKVTKLQALQMDAIRAGGGQAFVVEGKDGTFALEDWLSFTYTVEKRYVNPF